MATNKKQEAKDYIENRISISFGPDFINVAGDKIYVYGKAKDGEKIPIAISLTCPNAANVPEKEVAADLDWSNKGESKESTNKLSAKPQEEKDNIQTLLSSLGL